MHSVLSIRAPMGPCQRQSLDKSMLCGGSVTGLQPHTLYLSELSEFFDRGAPGFVSYIWASLQWWSEQRSSSYPMGIRPAFTPLWTIQAYAEASPSLSSASFGTYCQFFFPVFWASALPDLRLLALYANGRITASDRRNRCTFSPCDLKPV